MRDVCIPLCTRAGARRILRGGPRPLATLIAGPTIAAVGFALFALSGPSTSYWSGFLAPIAIIGLGMAVTVAPLTTTVINAVPEHQTGVASGINNAVASVATLL
jgi:hypothetical protein